MKYEVSETKLYPLDLKSVINVEGDLVHLETTFELEKYSLEVLVSYFDKDDKVNNEMYIYPISKDYALSGELKESSLLQISLSKTYARICSKPLLEYLCKQFNITILKKEYKRYNARYDESKKVIIVDMKGVES